MKFCNSCGEEIVFRYVGGVCKPIHTSGNYCRGYKVESNSSSRGSKAKPIMNIIKDSYKWDYPHIKKIETHESFVNPNAKCPVCKEPVFFYQSPYGGKVFFDELGPPWSKHPCTDNSFKKAPLGISKDKKNQNKYSFSWIDTGWYPYIIEDVKRINNRIFSFDIGKSTYISTSGSYSVKKGSILHIKKMNNLFYEASILNENNLEVKVVILLKKDFYSSTISIQILANLFFKVYRENNSLLMDEIINHSVSKKYKIDGVFDFIYKNGFDNFFKILRRISDKCPKYIIHILTSVDDIYVKTIVHDIFKESKDS